MGLLLDLAPEGGMEDGGNEEELEAELLALMGDEGGKSTAKKNGGKGESTNVFLFLFCHCSVI